VAAGGARPNRPSRLRGHSREGQLFALKAPPRASPAL